MSNETHRRNKYASHTPKSPSPRTPKLDRGRLVFSAGTYVKNPAKKHLMDQAYRNFVKKRMPAEDVVEKWFGERVDAAVEIAEANANAEV